MRRTSGKAVALPAAGLLVVALVSSAVAQTASPAKIDVRPSCGKTGSAGLRYEITVEGQDFNPATGVLVTFDAGTGGRPESFRTSTDGFGRFRRVIDPLRRSRGLYVVRADDFKLREAESDFVVPCAEEKVKPAEAPPELSVVPPIGPPGFVTAAVGENFPPGAAVAFEWTPGIDPPDTAIVGPDGRFEVQVLIFHRDTIGPRRLTAIPRGSVSFQRTDATEDFLVVPARLQPSEFVTRQ